jgi:hypothetical protein
MEVGHYVLKMYQPEVQLFNSHKCGSGKLYEQKFTNHHLDF